MFAALPAKSSQAAQQRNKVTSDPGSPQCRTVLNKALQDIAAPRALRRSTGSRGSEPPWLAIRDTVRALGIQVRAGLHTGECELRGDDIGGIAVHVGARVSALAGPTMCWCPAHCATW